VPKWLAKAFFGNLELGLFAIGRRLSARTSQTAVALRVRPGIRNFGSENDVARTLPIDIALPRNDLRQPCSKGVFQNRLNPEDCAVFERPSK
jgi:hypothetical protein